MSKQFTLVNFWLYIILIAMSVSPAFALGADNRNLLLIGVMCLSPLVILRYMEFRRRDILLMSFMLCMILFPLLNHPQTMRWSTVLYTCLFCSTFMALPSLLVRNNFTTEKYLKLLKRLIYAYAIVLLIQQFCVLTEVPIFNLGNYDPRMPWKLNSLTSEPSHSVRILAILMYCYITIKEVVSERKYSFKLDWGRDKWVWCAFLWAMVTSFSGTAFLFLAIVLLKFLTFRTFLPLIGIVAAVVGLTVIMEVTAVERTYKTFMATLTLDERTIMKADGSAASRIVPAIVLAKNVTIFDKDGLFGHGVGQTIDDRVVDMSSVGYGRKGVAGTMLTLWYDYGFIVFILFLIFTLNACIVWKDWLSFIFWAMIVFQLTINMQIVWFCIIALYLNKMFTIKNKLNVQNTR